jgi:hypothetical protein
MLLYHLYRCFGCGGVLLAARKRLSRPLPGTHVPVFSLGDSLSTSTGTGYNTDGRGLEATPSTASYTNSPPAHAEPRRSTQTKAAFKTTEFMVYIASVIGVLIASAVVGTTHAHIDYFRADKAWFFIVLLTIGYVVSRGLAKSGSREHNNGS